LLKGKKRERKTKVRSKALRGEFLMGLVLNTTYLKDMIGGN